MGLFATPLPDVIERAVKMAREAEAGELGEAAEAAYNEQIEKDLQASGLTMDQLDRLGEPRTWLGRVAERVQDWWWEKTTPRYVDEVTEGLEATLAFPAPLLRTHPLQDVPFDYDDVDRQIGQAVNRIGAAISAETRWTPVSFERPEAGVEEDDFDPLELIVSAWEIPGDPALLLLVSGPDEDPKLMGCSLGMAHLVGALATALRVRLN